VHTLPFLEAGNLYNAYEPAIKAGSIGTSAINGVPAGQVQPPRYMKCPSDEYANDPAWPTSNYVGSMGPQYVDGACGYNPYSQYMDGRTAGIPTSENYGGSQFDVNNPVPMSQIRGCFTRAGIKVPFGAITDGLSNTIMVGEWRPQDMAEGRPGWYVGDTSTGHWARWKGGAAYGSTLAPINYRTDDLKGCTPYAPAGQGGGDPARSIENAHLSFGFKSRHTGGANFTFADGSVRFLSETIDHTTYQYLGCRDDGQVLGAY